MPHFNFILRLTSVASTVAQVTEGRLQEDYPLSNITQKHPINSCV